MADSFASFAAKLDKAAANWTGPELKAAMTRVGEQAQQIAEKAASADLGGDPKFSGWAPRLETQIKHTGPGAILIQPGRFAAGAWTVAEFGRNSQEGPRPTVRLTRKGTVSRARQKRWNGRTPAKHTASDAVKVMNVDIPKAIEKEWARAISDTLGG